MKEPMEKRTAASTGDNEVNVHWDDANMRSSYSNVCNVTGTREELVLLFGVHQAWQSGAKEVKVQLQERIILSPYAAKRLNVLLTRLLQEYEKRYGSLQIEATAGPSESLPTG